MGLKPPALTPLPKKHMAGPVDPEKRQKALSQVSQYLALRPGEIIRFDCTFVSGTDHFVARIDYSVAKKGGYQIIEGDIHSRSIFSITPVMGKGRTTPRFPLVPTMPVKTGEQLDDEKRKADLEMEFNPMFDDERTS